VHMCEKSDSGEALSRSSGKVHHRDQEQRLGGALCGRPQNLLITKSWVDDELGEEEPAADEEAEEEEEDV